MPTMVGKMRDLYIKKVIMEREIHFIIEKLLRHDITRQEAVNDIILCANLIGNSENVNKALNASASALYFNDSSDFKTYHYEVFCTLTGLKDAEDEDIRRIYCELNPE